MPDPSKVQFPVLTNSEDETRSVGESFGRTLHSGDIVALIGDLGTGKTQFVKGVCHAKGISSAAVSSPTFTVINEYPSDPPIYHLDLYRIKSRDEAIALGIEEYLEGEGICLIEWPDIIRDLLPAETNVIRIEHRSGDSRSIELIRAK